MTTSENFVYRFDAALHSGERTKNTFDLVQSLGVAIEVTDPRWKGLVATIDQKRLAGYDYNVARASLALLCQDILAPIQSPIEWFFAETEYDNPNISTSFPIEGAKRVYCLIGSVRGDIFHRYCPIHSNPVKEFPEVLGAVLRDKGYCKELKGVQIRDRLCQDLSTRKQRRSRVLLEFYDCERSVVWWSVGIGPGHLTSTTQAAFDGYRFALDPRRTELQKKPSIHSGHELR